MKTCGECELLFITERRCPHAELVGAWKRVDSKMQKTTARETILAAAKELGIEVDE